MDIDDENYTDIPLTQKDTRIFQHTAGKTRFDLPTMPQVPTEQVPPKDPAVINALINPFEARAISKLETPQTSKQRVLNLPNFRNVYKHVMTDPLYKNSLFNIAGTFVLGGLGFFSWIIIARLYKPEDVGIATTLVSIMGLLNSLTILGLHSSLSRFLPNSIHKSELINSSFVIVTLMSLVACVMFLLGLPIFSPPLVFLRSNTFYILSFTLLVSVSSWTMLIESIFMAFRSTENIFAQNSVIGILKIILPFVFVVFSAYGAYLSVASSSAMGMFFSVILIIFRFKIKPSLKVRVSLIRETLAYSFANYMVCFMSSMPGYILPIILINVLSEKYAAYYYVASQIQSFLQFIPLAAAGSLLVEGAYSTEKLTKYTKKAFITILLILLPAILVIVLAGNIVLQFFGKNYASEAFAFLQLYSISTIFTAFFQIANAIMNIKHQMKLLIISNILSSLLTLGLSCAFISGKLVGIGWGILLGQAIVGGIALFFIIRNVYVAKRVE